ncbi:MAG: 3-oxoadipyl-CoA thiolase [Gammaproteobacteria bacterium]
MSDAFICDAVRTPIGRYGGGLSTIRCDDLAAIPIKALVERNPKLDAARIEDVIYGCANQAGEDNRNVARMAGLLAGLPEEVAGVTVNRLCGSGMDAVAMASRAIRCGEAELIIAGGVESMSRAPLVMPKAEVAFSRRAEIFDTTIGWRFVNRLFKEKYGIDSMPETAENVAAEFGISREDQDAFAWRSQQKAEAAMKSGRLSQEIVPVSVPRRKAEPLVVAQDEHPRPGTTPEQLARLATPFREHGTVTAGNASGVNDGACALLVASETAAEVHGLVPRARVVATAVSGVSPRIMGIGPVPAVNKLLLQTGLRLADVGIVELNEAFAAQSLAVLRGLGFADDAPMVNPNGGAIALGHPLGMSGARLVATAMHEFAVTDSRLALCTMCIGVGQGIAMLLERV